MKMNTTIKLVPNIAENLTAELLILEDRNRNENQNRELPLLLSNTIGKECHNSVRFMNLQGIHHAGRRCFQGYYGGEINVNERNWRC